MMAELDILNGFAGKVISDCIDIAIDKIIKADKNRKAENQTIETRIYQVTIDALNKFPYNKYKKKEKVYDAAENILKELKRGNRIYKEAVRAGLNMLSSEVTGDICKDFLELLCYEICRKENRDLAIGHIIHQGEKISEWQQQMDRHLQEEFKENNQNHEETHRKLDYLIEKENGKEIQDANYSVKSPVVNRADEYAQRWNKNVFLNNFNKRDKDADTNIKLKDIYLEEHLPHYVWKANEEPLDDLKTLLREYITDKDDRQMLLILGQPGIGKSTLITWIMANLVEKKDDIYVYQFASDLKNINWQGDNVLNNIFQTVSLNYNELDNKVLILDGFDEINVNSNRETILNQLYHRLKGLSHLDKFSVIITCRENYVSKLNMLQCDYITLQAWNDKQIRSFCKIYEDLGGSHVTENTINNIVENQEILGIPLILYMVLALNISIEKNASIMEVYDHIFSIDGGIYDRCIKNFGYGSSHWIANNKEWVHRVTQKVAFWIFENKAEEEFILQSEYKKICNDVKNDMEKEARTLDSDTVIGNYFKSIRHCEGVEDMELHFVHRSIYEYFVAVYFFESVCQLESKEEVAGKLGELLRNGHLQSKEMLEFIYHIFNSRKGYNLADNIKCIFDIMLRFGMTYNYNIIEEQKASFWEYLRREETIFCNMLELMHLWYSDLGECDIRIIFYLELNRTKNLNLKGIRLGVKKPCKVGWGIGLRGVNLFGADLREANLAGADLSGADLRDADLSGAFLWIADLSGVFLGGADIYKTDFTFAYLKGADIKQGNLKEANLEGADLTGADLSGAQLEGAGLERTQLIGAWLIGAGLENANLKKANLEAANLSMANLREANLTGANLTRAELTGADLSGTLFDEKQVNLLCKNYDLSKSKVYLSQTYEVISYQEYCLKI